ncbi:PadR family transcriptional regulator [Georgenia yuyongxinii]|uniref:PadR family transcriptional regulator n=1 Tax=Georgenia yuyongxinii TaxID=2589797 RepID=A0A552WNC5_9MICO|nr:PadR family transcriptional regulator [Georgenia yuyongxinii]TRW44250.1 PadR family transcriptional regulator [Georgenia yuyongxinii]
MSLKHALLGILHAQPMNGYRLARFFAGAQSWVWSAPQSQVYGVLRTLSDEGLIVGEEQAGAAGPRTTVYSLTATGQHELREWIATPHPAPPLRDPFALQALLFDLVDPDEAVPAVRAYLADQERLVTEWTEHRDALLRMDTPLLRARLETRDAAEHERIARLKANVFDGQLEVARARAAWARRTLELLAERAPARPST